MNKLLAVSIFMLCFAIAFALKCYDCTSKTSMADCDKNKKEKDCPEGADRCLTLLTEFKVQKVETKFYHKTCSTKQACDSKALLNACNVASKVVKGNCTLDCCDKDLCNGGTAPLVSVLLLLACALVTFLS